MSYRFLGIMLFVSVLLVKNTSAQTTTYLPQVANGDYGSGSYRTTFVLFNNTNNTVTADLDLTDDRGNPLSVNITGCGTGSNFNFSLPAGSSKLLQTDGKGSVTVGAATITSSASIGVSAIFSIYDSAGNYLTEAGVGSSDPQTTFILPVDTTGSFNTGLALYNPNNTMASVTMTLRDTNGQTVGTSPLQLARGSHIARFIAGNGQLFPSIGAFQGTLLVQCSTPVAAVVLRQYQDLSTLSFTSLPVVPSSSTKTALNVAQVANGGGYWTSFLIFNISSAPANITLALTKDDGSALNVNIPGRGNSNLFTITNLAPGGSVFMRTDGSPSSPTVGAAKITSNVPIGASGVFAVANSGVFQTETGVGDSPLLTSFTLPLDITGNFDTGVAFFNPGNTPATLSFRRIDDNGVQVGSVETKNLPAQGHLATFASQIFNASNFRGSVAVSSNTPIAAMTLRMNNPPLSFTTLPVVSGVSNGSAPPASGSALLSKTETPVDATTNITFNEVLPSGFKLTGRITGPGTAAGVMAKAGQDSVYSGSVNLQGKYVVILPAGDYELSVMFVPNGVSTGQRVSVVAAIPGSVQVTSDTTRDITLPSVPVFSISGTVNGIANLGTPGTVSIHFGTADASMGGSFLVTNGSYSGVLPAGSYTAGISAAMTYSQLSSQKQSLGIYDLGSVTIGGNTTLPPFTVPATARLSGTVRGISLPAFGITVDATGPNGTISSSSGADMFTAQYQAVLPKNTNYAVSASIMLIQGTDYLGSITFPLSGNRLQLTGDTGNYDFTVPSLQGTVIISGQVTDSKGKPVNGAAVSAVSESITGTPDLRYSNAVQTDASGNYRLTVLKGSNYRLTFIPPLLQQ